MKLQVSSNKLLLFDFGCVIINLDKQRCINALNKVGLEPIASYVDEQRSEDLFHELELGGSTERFCEEARRQSSYTDEMGIFRPCTTSDEEVCWAWNELLTGIDLDKLRYIKHLRDDLGYRTAILSNTNWIHWDKSVKDYFTVDGLQVDDYFDHIFLSCELGIVKPDERIYQAVIDTMNVRAEDVIFFDDSERNCEGARRYGFTALHCPKGNEWMHILRDSIAPSDAYAAVIGNFDGVHLGHHYILENLKEVANRNELKPLVITFDKHPREVFDSSFVPSFITTQQEKQELLRAEVENVKVFCFDKDFAKVSARDFIEHTLRDELGVKLLLLGYDNRFGKRNTIEKFEHYQQYGKELGIKVLLANPIDVDGVRVSSSQIRHAIADGRMEEVTMSLGRPYSITGVVQHGHEEGRKIGFPTANILPPADKIIPPRGVYKTMVNGMPAITNVGVRPTYNGDSLTVETHIPDFSQNLYGKEMTVHFISKIRDEIAFSSPEELKSQIIKDLATLNEIQDSETTTMARD